MAEEVQETQEEQPKKKPPLLTIALVAVVMLVEAVGVVAFLKFSGGGASSAQATEMDGVAEAEEQKTVELPVWGDQRQTFQNLASGRAWSWQVVVVLQVKSKNRETVEAELARRQAEVTEGIALIIRRAAHSHLTEPGLETLDRQLTAFIEQIFGIDPEGVPMVEQVLIPKCQGVPSE